MAEERFMTKELTKTKEKKQRNRSITEVAAILSVEPHVLRYWEDELSLNIERSETGRRMYTPEDIKLFQKIMEYKNQGMKMKEIKELGENELKKMFLDDNKSEDEEMVRNDMAFIYPLISGKNTSKRDKKTLGDYGSKKNRFIYQMEKNRGEGNKQELVTNSVQNKKGTVDSKEWKKLSLQNEEIVADQVNQTLQFVDKTEKEKLMIEEEKADKIQRLQALLVNALNQSMEYNLNELKKEMNLTMKESIQKELDFQFRQQEEKWQELDRDRAEKEELWRKQQEEHFQKIDELLRSRRVKKRNRS